jgi:hypothetical protein
LKEIQISSEGNPSRIGRNSKFGRKEIQIKTLDFLRRIEPYQEVARIPMAFFLCCAGSGGKGAAAA